MTMVDERTDLKVSDGGDHDRFQHYFPKAHIEANLLKGVPMTALCGRVIARQVDPAGRPVCGTCQDLFDNVCQPGDDE